MMKSTKNQNGFTLIEMIGVLAIIAILVGAVAPRIFEAIEDSKITSSSSLVKSLQSSVSKYYSDMGTLLSIANIGNNDASIRTQGEDGAGNDTQRHLASALTHTKTSTQNQGFWPKFRGPYLESFETSNPPIGTSMRISTMPVANVGAASDNSSEINFDLSGEGTNDFVAGSEIVALVIEGVGAREWEKFDAMFDANVIQGLSEANRQARGRIKFNPGTSTMRVYIAHK
jgi:prepilin-type N-terminal cleavage/methylation domain-containing protein